MNQFEMKLEGEEDAQAVGLHSPYSSGEWLILLHGGGNDRFFGFKEVIRCALERGYHVATMHLPGHGRGGRDFFSVEATRRRVDVLVTQVRAQPGCKRITLLGHSMGGSFAVDAALRAVPIERVIAVSALLELELSWKVLLEVGVILRPSTLQTMWRLGLYETLPAFGPFKREEFPIRIKEKENYLRVFKKALKELKLEERAQTMNQTGADIIVIQGELDQITPIAQARRLAQVLGEKGKLRVIPGKGHFDLLLDPMTLEEYW